MSTYKIDSDIPLPKERFPLDAMHVGQSFMVPNFRERNAAFAQAKKQKIKIVGRAVWTNNENRTGNPIGYRIWRAA